MLMEFATYHHSTVLLFVLQAMLACYPGQGRCYRRHIDNPNQDGRAITAIYYINKAWSSQVGYDDCPQVAQ